MFTGHIGNKKFPEAKKGDLVYVIGVKRYEVPASTYSNSYTAESFDLDNFLTKNPEWKLVKRFDEVVNPRYYEYPHSQHTLQPALITRA